MKISVNPRRKIHSSRQQSKAKPRAHTKSIPKTKISIKSRQFSSRTNEKKISNLQQIGSKACHRNQTQTLKPKKNTALMNFSQTYTNLPKN
jgi:hypothetical protein